MFSNWLSALKSNRASVAIQTALVLIALIGMVALGTEMVYLLYKHRQMQSAADAAAMAGAVAKIAGAPGDFHTEVYAVAANNGYTNGVNGVTVAIANPPLTGDYADNAGAIKVTVAQSQLLSMVSLFRSGTFAVGASAVALIQSNSLYCILALDPSASGAININNNAVVANNACGVAVNSSSNTALILSNNAAINGPVNVHGRWRLSNNAKLNGTPTKQNGPVIANPYAGRTVQTPPACTAQSGSGSGTINLTAGHFCSGWNFGNNVTVNLAAGIYYIDTRLTLGNNAIVTGTGGVTLVVNGNYAVSISNNVHLTLTAPATGPYAGLAMFSSPSATSTITQTFSNNAVIKIVGAIYFPNQIIDYENNGATTATRCTQIIGRQIIILNNVQLNNNCDNTGTSNIGSSTSRLVQ